MTSTATSEAMSTATKAAVIDLLYRLADDSLIIGHRNSEWTGLGPILEEDIAFSSMAQDKMGHALALYGLLHQLGEEPPDRLAFARGPRDYRCCDLVAMEFLSGAATDGPLCNNPVRDELVSRGDWAGSLVRQFLFSEADAVRMAALETSAYEPMAQLARKLRGELKYHTLHGRLLIERLGKATEDSRSRLNGVIERVWPQALGMFEPTKHGQTLASAGICPTEEALCDRWLGEVEPIIERSGLSRPKHAKPAYGGRAGNHPPELALLLDDMQRVYRLDPTAQW